MKQFIASLFCAVAGHRRGKRIVVLDGAPVQCLPNERVYQCPRCRATWTRKAKVGA